jgi:hypothetical protein
LFFVYINVLKKHHIQAPTVSTPFVWFCCRFIFVQLWRVFFVQNENQSPSRSYMSMRFPRVMAIFWIGDLFFVYINVLTKHHIQEPTLSTPFVWFCCRFVFVQLWGVFFLQNENQSPSPNYMFMRFPPGMAIFWTGDLFFVYINVLTKHHIQEPTLSTPSLWFCCRFVS